MLGWVIADSYSDFVTIAIIFRLCLGIPGVKTCLTLRSFPLSVRFFKFFHLLLSVRVNNTAVLTVFAAP